MKKNHFYKTGVDITKAKSMFDYINGHFTYFTLNSWNQLRSIANNVKLHNLNLDGDWSTALGYVLSQNDVGDLQFQINEMIKDWEAEHPGYLVGFNGHSLGYLVMYNKDNNRSIVPDSLLGYDTYEEWKESIRDSWYHECVKDYMPTLRETTKLIQSFDRLCDDIRELVNTYSKMDYQESVKAFNEEYGAHEGAY
jgi:hypothetical protein